MCVMFSLRRFLLLDRRNEAPTIPCGECSLGQITVFIRAIIGLMAALRGFKRCAQGETEKRSYV